MTTENHVVVTNIQMPFLSMVWFMVKWSIAAIPAAIILFFLLAILFGVFGAFVGLGPETLRDAHPSLVYCSINGYGASGPLAAEPSYDNVIQAYSGLMSVTGTETSGPVRSGLPLADLLTGVFAATGILAALVERGRSGEGQHVQASLLESLVGLMSFHALTYLLLGQVPGLAGNHHPIMSPTGLFRTSDGQIVIATSISATQTKNTATGVVHAIQLNGP